jgi:hypothetical protein
MARRGFGSGQVRHSGGARVAAGLQVGSFGAAFIFSDLRPVGRYANGDWWVLGPVNFTAITPSSFVQASGTGNAGATPYTNRTVHGTMVNPGNRAFATGGLLANNTANSAQGWDSLPNTSGLTSTSYNDAFNVDPASKGPLTVATGSVVKFVSRLANLPSRNAPAGDDMVVLTVVDSIPPPDAIRPGVSGTNKASRLRLSDFSLGVFQNLAPTANAPTYAEALAWVSRYHENAMPMHVQNSNAKGANNQPWYARDEANNIHRALLCLHLSSFTPDQKRQLLAGLAAIAEDIVSRAEEGGVTLPDGGAVQFKLALLAVLAASLGVKTPAAWLPYLGAQRNVWAEYLLTFRVTPFDVALPRLTSDSRPRVPFNTRMIGSVEGAMVGMSPAVANRAHSQWIGNEPNANILYRDNVANAGVLPGGLAMELTTGAKGLWDFEDYWLYYATCYANRNEAGVGNELLPFCREMLDTYRTPIAAAPAVVETGVRDADLWLRCSLSLDDAVVTAPPPTSAFTVLVNGAARTVTATQVWRQNVGLSLASPVTATDVVTVSYAVPASNPVRSVDGIALASFTGLAVANRTEKTGGSNAAFPIVRFTPSASRRTITPVTIGPANASVGTVALLRFRFPSIPAATSRIFGAISGNPGLTIFLTTSGRVQLDIRNAAGTQIASVSSPVLLANTDYDLLFSLDVTQTTNTAGANCFVNGSSGTISFGTWAGGAGVVIGWNRDPGGAMAINQNGVTFDFGALYINTAARVDITSSAERAKFAAAAIGSQGAGVTGSIPALFLVGNAAQWNDDFGVQRGAGARFFPNNGASLGSVSAVSGPEWV